ncbi:Ca(2+)-binding ATP:ADP antiporter [Starmerella bacillaris]|uniref:Ca(2+)-binding ATP:ADP antiporter n=1 Tax=Starmerella bacillaris TaxID=1247836 RepID=A0AAV5RFR2_STABA|nr:Ca(2+)-binding ATP:ADP antiporter [Starmerella bacillaris]
MPPKQRLDEELDADPVLENAGYFLAGGIAGVVSRTCTAPFDRLKVFLIANNDTTPMSARQAVQKIYYEGKPSGVRAFFKGNGLNVIKVLPDSGMKFGGFETAKKVLARLEGKPSSEELSAFSTYIAGGIGGMMSQLTVYPIDTIKFRMQCEQYSGRGVVFKIIRDMYAQNGLRMFYRGLYVGVLGMFPMAAIDLGSFSMLRAMYKAEFGSPGNLSVLAMGAMSGSIGATVVYPINLVRTRLQTQGTAGHKATYKGFIDCYKKTVAKEGYRGLYRGLAPNLGKVAPSVAISYMVYEKAKKVMNLP